MLIKIIKYFWSLRRQFIKYFIIGVIGVVLDMSSLIFFKEVLGWMPVVAVIVNQAFMLAYIFILNKCWTFKNKEMPHGQIAKFLALAGFNYAFAVAIMYVFNHEFGFDYRLVRICSIALMVSWNFLLYKYWVYKEVQKEAVIYLI